MTQNEGGACKAGNSSAMAQVAEVQILPWAPSDRVGGERENRSRATPKPPRRGDRDGKGRRHPDGRQDGRRRRGWNDIRISGTFSTQVAVAANADAVCGL